MFVNFSVDRGTSGGCLDSASTLERGAVLVVGRGLERRAAWRQGDKSIGEDREEGMLYKGEDITERR
jgi:hypothetical protein